MRTPTRLTTIAAVVLMILAAAEARAQQTIVFMRHGEKPAGGYGQITCQGLNRALALPDVLIAKYGKPNYIYAPNPAAQISDPAGTFYYVRPLATIEPTAVRLGMNVRTKYAFNDITSLKAALITSTKATSTIFVAWEHQWLQKLVQNIMTAHGGGQTVPAWISGDYDTLYVVRVDYIGSTISAHFSIDHEGLNGQPTTCPH
jgi:hypothetical protein